MSLPALAYLSSWWYFKGTGDGVTNWTATPAVFPPGGTEGIEIVTQTTGWKVIGHNRFWVSAPVAAAASRLQ